MQRVGDSFGEPPIYDDGEVVVLSRGQAARSMPVQVSDDNEVEVISPPTNTNQEESKINLDLVRDFTAEFVTRISKLKHYQIFKARNSRIHGALHVKTSLGYDAGRFSTDIWEIFKGKSHESRETEERRIAVGIAIRKLGLSGYESLFTAREATQDFGEVLEKNLQFVTDILPAFYADAEAWQWVCRMQTAQDLEIPVSDVPECFVTPEWEMDTQDELFLPYPFEKLAYTGNVDEFLSSDNSFTKLFGVYLKLKASIYHVSNLDIYEILINQSPLRRVKLFDALDLKATIPDVIVKVLIDQDRLLIAQEKKDRPPRVRNDVEFDSRSISFSSGAHLERIFTVNKALLETIRKDIIFEHPILSAKIQESYDTMGCVFFNAEEQKELLDYLSKLEHELSRDQFEDTLFAFIDGHHITFAEEARSVWHVDNRLHFVLYYASCVPLLERGKRIPSEIYKEIRPAQKLRKVDPFTTNISSDSCIRVLRKAQKLLVKKHLIELDSITMASKRGNPWQPSAELQATIEALPVDEPIKGFLVDLFDDNLRSSVMGTFSLGHYIRARLGMRLALPVAAIPKQTTSIASFLWQIIERTDDSKAILGPEDQTALRNKIEASACFNKQAEERFSSKGFWAVTMTPELHQSLVSSIRIAREHQIPDEIIKGAVLDLFHYYNVENNPEDKVLDEVNTWLKEIPQVGCPEFLLSTRLQEGELKALCKPMAAWKAEEIQRVDCTASSQITEIVPCLFIQSASNDKRLIFPWCALMSERGLEAIVKESYSMSEDLFTSTLLKEALGEDTDLKLCKEKGLAVDPAELYSLMRAVANSLKNGKKVCLLAQFLQVQPSRGSGGSASGGGESTKKFDWKKKDEIIRHPGLLECNDEVKERKKSAKLAARSEKRVASYDKLPEKASELPDWTHELYDDGSHFYFAANQLIQHFAQESLTQMDVQDLLDVETRKVLPPIRRFDHLELVPDSTVPYRLSLRDYQKRSIRRCMLWEEHGVNGILCLDTGLGKTRIGCELLLRKHIQYQDRASLVIAPNAVKAEWKREFDSTVEGYEDTVKILNTPQELKKALSDNETGVLICGDSQVLALLKDEESKRLITAFRPSMVVLDEAHQLLTLHDGGKQEAFKKLLESWADNKNAPIVALTATPIVNDMTDVMELLSLINPEVVAASSMHRFQIAMDLLKRNLQSSRKTHDELANKVALDLKLASDQAIKNALFNLVCIREMVILPLLEKVSRDDDEIQAMPQDEMPVVRDVKKSLNPQGREREVIDKIVATYKGQFFEKTHKLDRALIHPELSTLEVDDVIKKFTELEEGERLEYISQSSMLKAVFVSRESELTMALERNQKAVLFVKLQDTAEFLRHIVKARYNLDDDSIFVHHSGIKNRKAVIEQFKAISGKGAVLILLPKSGGTGLNFTDVGTNIMMTTEWTYEKDKQARGRIIRGVGEKVIVSMRHELPQRKHLLNIVRKKKHLDRLILASKNSSCKDAVVSLLKTCEAMVSAEEKNVLVTDGWSAFFRRETQAIGDRFQQNLVELECEYLEKRAQAFMPKAPQCAKDLLGYVVSSEEKTLQCYTLVPMPTNGERKPFVRALQIALLQDITGNKSSLSALVTKMHQEKELSIDDIARLVRTTVPVLTTANDAELCLQEAEKQRLSVITYEFSKGIWGSHLMAIDSRGAGLPIRFLKGADTIYLMVENPHENRPFHFA